MDVLSALKSRFFPTPAQREQRRRDAAALRLLEVRNRTSSGSSAGTASTAHLQDTPPPRPPKPDPLQRFTLPSGHLDALAPLMPKYRRLLDSRYAFPLQELDRARSEALKSFVTLRSQLVEAALAPPAQALGVRRPWPDLAPPSSQGQLLERLYQCANGLVVGENRAAQASKRLLSDHMPDLRRLGVTTLYLQNLQSELHQSDLDQLRITGSLSPALDRFLEAQNVGHTTHAAGDATLHAVVQAAAKAGIRIVALDLMGSYHLGGAEDTTGTPTPDPLELRIKVMNHVAVQRILHDQRRQRETVAAPRWVALVGDAHAGTFNNTPGLDARLGVPSLRVEDISPSWTPRLRFGCDPVRDMPAGLGRGGGTVQCDYLLQVPARDGRARDAKPKPCSASEALRQHDLHQARHAAAGMRTA